MVGNAAKAGVRFVSYDYFKQRLADSQVSLVSCGVEHLTDGSSRVKLVLLGVC